MSLTENSTVQSPDTTMVKECANHIRRLSAEMTFQAGSGHPTSCMSCSEILAVLFEKHLHFDIADPDNIENDVFILSKGHAAPALWAVLSEMGAFPRKELFRLRQFGSTLEGHPTPRSPWVKVTTGSLGQGLSVGVGTSLNAKREGHDTKTYVLLGDGELAEGSIWEACSIAEHYALSNLIAIVDANNLGQTGRPLHYDGEVVKWDKKFKAFGWKTMIVDGHSIESLDYALESAKSETKSPVVIIAKTTKGEGLDSVAGKMHRHGKPLEADELKQLQATIPLNKQRHTEFPSFQKLKEKTNEAADETVKNALPDFDFSNTESIAPRKAFSLALEWLGRLDNRIMVLDGDVSNSTYTNVFEESFPERFVQSFIAEQNMAGMAMGFSAQGKIPCMVTFSAFLTRAFDQLRIADISGLHMVVGGTHCGISIGEDGPSQMGLEDLAMFRSLDSSSVLVPSDAVSTFKLVQQALITDGIAYLRLDRSSLPNIYDPNESFPLGSCKIHTLSSNEQATLFSCGLTVHEALKVQHMLELEGIPVRVVDVYSIKPLDELTIRKEAMETGMAIVVEDHRPQGGLGEAVSIALSGTGVEMHHLAVRGTLQSGSPEKLREEYSIDAAAIAKTVRSVLHDKNNHLHKDPRR